MYSFSPVFVQHVYDGNTLQQSPKQTKYGIMLGQRAEWICILSLQLQIMKFNWIIHQHFYFFHFLPSSFLIIICLEWARIYWKTFIKRLLIYCKQVVFKTFQNSLDIYDPLQAHSFFWIQKLSILFFKRSFLLLKLIAFSFLFQSQSFENLIECTVYVAFNWFVSKQWIFKKLHAGTQEVACWKISK